MIHLVVFDYTGKVGQHLAMACNPVTNASTPGHKSIDQTRVTED